MCGYVHVYVAIPANAVFTQGKFTLNPRFNLGYLSTECCAYLRTFSHRIREKYARGGLKLQGGCLCQGWP